MLRRSSSSNKPLSLDGCSLEHIEQFLNEQGVVRIAGVDEAGRGPLAGPVVAACCVLPHNLPFLNIQDSKLLSEQERERVYEELTANRDVHWHVSCVGPEIIDAINIRQATLRAMKEAVHGIHPGPDFVLIDGRDQIDIDYPQQAIIKGDRYCRSIGAASIIAKVTRDRLMCEIAKQYVNYGFERHKGYPTKEHVRAIEKYGVTDIHRKTYAPITDILCRNSSC